MIFQWRRAWVAWGLGLALVCACAAQPDAFAGRTIVSVHVTPEQILHPDDLARVEMLRAGSVYRREDVSATIDRLFATGRFDDIVAEAEPSGAGVAVRFVGTPARFIQGVSVKGQIKQPPNRGEIASITRLQIGALFREGDLQRAQERIQRLFTSNGLHEATVTPEPQTSADGQRVHITFRIHAGKRARYDMPVIQGETKLPESTIVRATGWRTRLIHRWRHVNEARTRRGLQGVVGQYQKRDRLSARVELESMQYDSKRRRVQPKLNIHAGPRIKLRTVEAKVSKGVLKRYVPVYQERAVDNDLLVEGARNLRDYFQSRGYYDADVRFRVQPIVNDEQTIEYVIAQGANYKLVNLEITGRTYFRETDLRERMFIQPATFLMRHGRFSDAFLKKDEENIANLYRANGFRDVRVISTVDRSYQGKAGDVSVTVHVEEGPQWIVDQISLTGVQAGDRAYLESGLASIAGQPFSELNMAADRSFVLTWYYSHGFPKAELKAAWQPSSTPHHANVAYSVEEGSRQYVRDVLVSGLKTTRSDLVSRRITMRSGDPLSPVQQAEIQRNFYDMGIFARVDTAIENLEGETDHKYVLYNFEEANRYTLAVGLGAQVARFGSPSSTSVASPGGSTGFSPQASLNLSRLNFLGRGHTVSLRGIYSNLQKRGSISYLAPRFQSVEGRNFTASLLYDNSLDVRTFASRRQEASVQIAQRLSKASTALLRLAYRRVSVSDVVIPVLLVPQLVQPVRLGIVSANFAQDRRNDAGDPSRGIYNTVDVGLATRYLGSQRSFGRVLARNATYHRLTREVVLARQTQFGLILPFSTPSDLSGAQAVPLPERFFGGGSESLRAFPYNQAGPRDTGQPVVAGGPASQPTGFPLGGNALLFNNTELRYPLLGPNLRGVLFHDMGNVYSTPGAISFRFAQRDLNDFSYLVHAVGFGVRYRTPVGPIRADLAYSVNPPAYLGFSGSAQELLQCGPSRPDLPTGCQTTRQSVSHFQFFFSIGQTF